MNAPAPGGTGRTASGPAVRRRLLPLALTVLVAALAALAAGCARHSAATPAAVVSAPASAFRGTALTTPVTMPDATLTDTAGQPFDLRRRTAGHITMLYVGYTRCPDVCPTTMAALGVAMLHVTERTGTVESMHMIASLPVPAHGTLTLAPGGSHIMIDHPARVVATGGTVHLTLTFAHAGTLTVPAQVRSYAASDLTPSIAQ